ncbi:MAG: replicative DNA helicase [Clostridia bacterium]|nr:replicative DNA helicase [Clostridia bacterium]
MPSDMSRTLPFSMEAEQSVLGAILIDPEKLPDIEQLISPEDFYIEEHAEIFSAMLSVFNLNKIIDAVTVQNELVSRGVYSEEETNKYLKTIVSAVPTASNAREYAKIVRDKSVLRNLIEASEKITDDAYSAAGSVNEQLEAAESRIYDIANKRTVKTFRPLSEIMVDIYNSLSERMRNPGAERGVKTGFSDIDKVLAGMEKGDLVLIGARPGMGKTSFAMNIAANFSKNSKKAVAVFSLEMSCEQLAARLISSEAFVDSYDLRSGILKKDDWSKIAIAVSELAKCNMLIDDTSGLTVTNMRSKLRRIKNLGLIVIDYLQLMQSEKRAENRVNEIADISRSLKLMAKDFGVPVITCAQLSRGPESRTDKRPMLSDLRDSGAIEQDADIVMFLYRDEYYNSDPDSINTAECIIAKNRHGETKKLKLGWQAQYTKFYSVENKYDE